MPFQLVLVTPKDVAVLWPVPGWISAQWLEWALVTAADCRTHGASSRHKRLPLQQDMSQESQRPVPGLNEKPEEGHTKRTA